jgi:hypothetical protein
MRGRFVQHAITSTSLLIPSLSCGAPGMMKRVTLVRREVIMDHARAVVRLSGVVMIAGGALFYFAGVIDVYLDGETPGILVAVL